MMWYILFGTNGKIYFQGLDVWRVYHRGKVVYGEPDLRIFISIEDHLDSLEIKDTVTRISKYESDVCAIEDALPFISTMTDNVRITKKDVL